VSDGRLRAAVAASGIAADKAHGELLRSVAALAIAIFSARAASITTYEEASDELVFQAVAGEGEESLVGQRFPASVGLAGWVLQSREPLVIDDLSNDPRFARDVAEETGYVPKSMIAAPLLRDDDALGVISILDRPAELAFGVAEMDLLTLFARQASIALEVVERARRAGAAFDGESDAAVVARLVPRMEGLEGARREAALRLFRALEELL
jgi:GAF domain-containing protein